MLTKKNMGRRKAEKEKKEKRMTKRGALSTRDDAGLASGALLTTQPLRIDREDLTPLDYSS